MTLSLDYWLKLFAIIVTYNGSAWINKCLDSVIHSSVPVTAIVIDNGSTDETTEIIKKDFSNVQLIVSATNLGFGQANNVGIKKAYGQGADHILLLNQDAWVDKTTIARLQEMQAAFPQYGILSPIHLNGRGSALDEGFGHYINSLSCPHLLSDLYFQSFKEEPYVIQFVNAACWMLSRNCIETVGGFSPSFFHYGEDDNYIHRAGYHGFRTGLVPGVVVFHDRENRARSTYSEQSYQLRKELLVKFNNPITGVSIKDDISIHKKLLWKAYLLLNVKKTADIRMKLNLLKEISAQCDANLKLSKEMGLTFL